MSKDQLFLLRPVFRNPSRGEGHFHCPSCARVEGLLSFFPFLRDALTVHYVGFAKPRAEIVALLGEEHQSCPVLVLSDRAHAPAAQTAKATGRRFVAGADAISAYFAETFDISSPH